MIKTDRKKTIENLEKVLEGGGLDPGQITKINFIVSGCVLSNMTLPPDAHPEERGNIENPYIDIIDQMAPGRCEGE